ncbi:MAG TPA: TonB family protein [Bryobacteraceae bacterium]|nr:TonB family protein [Bryobacteraceae bacterium]
MTPHADILDVRESLRAGFWGSVALHLSLIGIALSYAFWTSDTVHFGDPNAGGAAVGVQAVKSIPIPHQGPANPVANDTQSQVPQTPAKPVERKQAETPPPDAIKLKERESKKKPAKRPSEQQRFRPYSELAKNQLTTPAAPQVSNPMYSAQAGSGRIGTGASTTLGSRCGAYAKQIQELVAQHWNTGDVDARYSTAPVVIATFDLMRNGSIRNLKLLQTSNIPSLDFSVQRAIQDASPFPPIPPVGCTDRDSARVEFNFELKR